MASTKFRKIGDVLSSLKAHFVLKTLRAALSGQRYQTNRSANSPVFPQKRQNKQRTGLELSRTRSELNHPPVQYIFSWPKLSN